MLTIPRRVIPGALLALCLTAIPARAADYYWNPATASGDWSSNANWSTPAPGTYNQNWANGNVANFSGANQSITINANIQPAGINFTGNVTSVGGAGPVILQGTVPISVSDGSIASFAPNLFTLSSGDSLVKQGAGTLVLSGFNNLHTMTISAGTLRLGSSNALSSGTANPALNVDGTLDLAGFSASQGTLSGSGLVTNGSASTASTLTVGGLSGSATFGGIIQNGAGTVALTKTGSGTQVLTGANTYAGATTISAGTLQIGSGGTAGALPAGNVSVAAGATFRVNKSALAGGAADAYAGVLSGGGNFAVSGGGRLAVTGNSAGFTGATAVSGGSALFVGSGLGGTVAVSGAGSSLGGSGGVFSGSVSLGAGTVLTLGGPGAGTTGSLTFGNGITLAGSASVAANRATFLVDVNGLNAGAATSGHDALLATGGIVSINGATLAFGAFTGTYAFGDRITLIDGSGTASLTGTFFDPSGNALANGSTVPDLAGRGGQPAWQIIYAGQDVFITPVPEPGTAVGAVAGLLGLSLAWRSRRRARKTAIVGVA